MDDNKNVLSTINTDSSTSHQEQQDRQAYLQSILTPEQFQLLTDLDNSLNQSTETAPVETEPASFTFNNITYTHLQDETRFLTNRSTEPITLIGMIKEALPKVSYSLRKTITPPDKLLMFSHSVRMKVTRAAQLYYTSPPILPETSSFVPLFKYLRDSVFMKNSYGIGRQYNAGLWASGYDDELATSLFLHYGPPQGFDRIKMQSPAIVKLKKEEEGFTIEVIYTHTIQDRINSACDQIWIEAHKPRSAPITREQLQIIGFKEVYWYAGTYLSIGSSLHEQIQGAVNAYLDKIAEFETVEQPAPPDILDPEDFLPEQTIYLPYADFLFNEELSPMQQAQRTKNGVSLLEKTLITKLSDINLSTIITRATFPQLNSKNLTAAVEHNYLTRIKLGHYQPTPKLIAALAVEGEM